MSNNLKQVNVRSIIEGNLEDTEVRDRVREWARANAGKRLAKNNIPDGFRISKQYGMTGLVSNDYFSSRGSEGSSFLLAYAETNVEVPSVEKLEELNPAYYSARDERNKLRNGYLKDTGFLHEAQARADRVSAAKAELERAEAALNELIDYPFPDSSYIEKVLEIGYYANKW